MQNITRLAFRYNQLTWMLLLLFMLSGLASYFYLGRNENAGFTVRAAQVITYFPGASPQRVEQLVTDKIEKRIQEMPEIDYITSESRSGISIINVKILDRYNDMDPIWNKLRRKVENAIVDLPASASTPIVNDEYGEVYGMMVGLVWDGFEYKDVFDIAENLRNEILHIPGIAKVEILGNQEERVYIEYRTSKLAELKLPPKHLYNTLKERNIISSGGIITSDTKRIPVEPSGNFDTIESLRNTLITIPGSDQVIKLEDVAHVFRGYENPEREKISINGKDAIVLSISMIKNGDLVSLGNQVKALLAQSLKAIPIGIEYESVIFMPEIVEGKIHNFMFSLYQSIGIVCLVIFAFLGLRTGLIVASLIPSSIIITFLAMFYLDIGLDQVSLPALMVALGMLVDNGIVMCESIHYQMEKGKAPVQAAIDSANELRLSLLISSLTTAVAFLPIFLAESSTGEYTAAIFKVVSVTLLTSWILSNTIIPMLCVSYLKVRKQNEERLTKLPVYIFYQKLLLSLLKRKLFTIAAFVAVFAISLGAFAYVPKIFFPTSDNPFMTAEFELPAGVSIARTEKMVRHIEDYIEENLLNKKGVEGWTFFIGNGGQRFRLQYRPEAPNPNFAAALIKLSDISFEKEITKALDQFILEHYPDVKAKIRPLQEGAPVNDPFEVRITGLESEKLLKISDQVKEKLESIPGTKSVVDDWGDKIRKVAVNIDEARAQRAGITNADVANSLTVALSGIELSQFREDTKLIPIEMRSVIGHNADNLSSETFNVYSGSNGNSVPLAQVADATIEWEHAKILRRNFEKTVTISSQLVPGYLAASIGSELEPWLKKQNQSWPVGYTWEFGGELYESKNANQSIKDKLPIALVMIVILLMVQFNCVRNTMIVLFTIPMSFIGVSFGLLITDSYFGFMTLLGLISLIGIVINDAIVLLERVGIEKNEEHHSPQNALIIASIKRFRPILLTTITTIAGLSPLYLYGGPMWEPMVIALVTGLTAATLLTLILVPVLYAIFFNINFQDFTWDPKVMDVVERHPLDSHYLTELVKSRLSTGQKISPPKAKL